MRTADGFARLTLTREDLIATLPQELTELRQFVPWKAEWREGRWTKILVDPRTGKYGSSTNPATWTTLDESLHFHEGHPESRGIGFVFVAGGGFVGIDLDNCIDECSSGRAIGDPGGIIP